MGLVESTFISECLNHETELSLHRVSISFSFPL